MITTDEILEAIEEFKACRKCMTKPTLFIEYEGLIISGCDKHMVSLGEMLRATGYYTKYQSIEDKSESDN